MRIKNSRYRPNSRKIKLNSMLNIFRSSTCRSSATRVSQFKILYFWIIGIRRNFFCRCTFNRFSVITQFAKLAAGEQMCRRRTHRSYSTSKTLNVSPKKSQIFRCDTCCRKWAVCVRNMDHADFKMEFLDLLGYFRFMWPCIINVGEERTNGWHK